MLRRAPRQRRAPRRGQLQRRGRGERYGSILAVPLRVLSGAPCFPRVRRARLGLRRARCSRGTCRAGARVVTTVRCVGGGGVVPFLPCRAWAPMLTSPAVCTSQVAVESRLHDLQNGHVFDTKSVKTAAWVIAEERYGESIAAARSLVAANLSLPTAWARGAQVQRVGKGGQGGQLGRARWRRCRLVGVGLSCCGLCVYPNASARRGPRESSTCVAACLLLPLECESVGARRGSRCQIYSQRPVWPAQLILVIRLSSGVSCGGEGGEATCVGQAS